MSHVPFRHQPVFGAVILAVILAATWIYTYLDGGGALGSLYSAGLDLALLLVLGIACLCIFAQFALPVTTLGRRLELSRRLWLHVWGAHGPATFVQNGRRIERHGEPGRAGPGLLWIDTASAAVMLTPAGNVRVLGPGIHFTRTHERLDKTFSLHIQVCTLGPEDSEPIFASLQDEADEETRANHEFAQRRRRAVSGLTRDGHEVIPQIQVSFKLDDSSSSSGEPGSRFGFSSDAVERAALGEGVNVDPATARRSHVAWNELPGLIATDLWREYLAKFTLDDLFTARFGPAPDVLQPEEPPPQAVYSALGLPAVPTGPAARVLWRLNNSLERLGNRQATSSVHPRGNPERDPATRMLPARQYTALQVIAYMVSARMSLAAVAVMDESGQYGKGHVASEEFRRLRERGIRVLRVNLGGFRVAPAVEELLVSQWKTTWLDTAAGERAHVEQLEALEAEAGRQGAMLEHAGLVGRALRSESEGSVPAALRAMLVASRNELLLDERLHGRGSEDLQALSALINWVEAPNDD